VGIPAGLAAYLESAHGLVAVECVLDGAAQDVVDAGMAIGRGRAFEENKLRLAFTLVDTFVENIVLLPRFEHPSVGAYKV